MPTGTISSSPDTVGVAVVNYEVPVVETKEQVLANCRKIAQYIEGTKRGYPGLDLIIFPEYSTQGFHPTKWKDLTTTVPGPETAIFSEACKKIRCGACSRSRASTTRKAHRSTRFSSSTTRARSSSTTTRSSRGYPWSPGTPGTKRWSSKAPRV